MNQSGFWGYPPEFAPLRSERDRDARDATQRPEALSAVWRPPRTYEFGHNAYALVNRELDRPRCQRADPAKPPNPDSLLQRYANP
jgi:hypothetical protein